MNRADEMTALFEHVSGLLNPPQWDAEKWGRPRDRVLVKRADMDMGGYRLSYVVAEAAEVGLFCREIVLRETKWLEFTKGNQS